ncbi:MAG: hypothetical protein P3W94_008955 [Paracoccus sp. (in: a-proteobacteria)]|nr:hypothetical protein [Paracoccus sp. (in: a-proteobacteria)]
MQNDIVIHELDDQSIDAVAGGGLPVAWLVAGAVTGAFGAGAGFGYMVGKDRAERDNRAD